MSVHISDSVIFQNSWGTPELRALFDDASLIAGWIEVMAVLAETQAEFGLIPAPAAGQIAAACKAIELNEAFFAEVRENFERTNHSLIGLILALQRRCPENSGEWLCFGATVQDITDTHSARILLKICTLFRRELAAIASLMRELARRYRDVPMCGRTHGQPGLPITFGFKVAGWLDEIQRQRQRLTEIETRIGVGQLAGGVGSLSAFGSRAMALQQRFCARLSLAAPDISWTASRDRLAEWLNFLGLMTATAERIGHEIYNLQRPEIGELSEGFVQGSIGSITMPQKRNPEISEHVGTLARMVRHHAAHMAENLVHDHERDGRSWKGEWVVLPSATLASGKVLALLHGLLENLQVNESKMLENLQATKGFVQAESVMLALAPHLGKQSAHALVYRLAMVAAERGLSLQEVLLDEQRVVELLGVSGIKKLFDVELGTGCCAEMAERVLAQASADL